MIPFLALAIAFQNPVLVRPQQLLTYAQSAVGSGLQARVEGLFQSKEDSTFLFEMAKDRGGLRSLQVAVIPAPPGWEDTGSYWITFHTRQDIESYHDPVYPVLQTDHGLKIGKEMPEWAGVESRIRDMKSDVHIFPDQSRATIRNWTQLDASKSTRAPIFRLNDFYRLSKTKIGDATARVVVADERVPEPHTGDVVRAGSLLIPWTTNPAKNLYFRYEGSVNSPQEDKINGKQVYLTAWWTPSIARLPHTSSIRITGPKPFVLRGEGNRLDPLKDGMGEIQDQTGDEQVASFRCDIPISYPKVIGGRYVLASEATIGGRQFRSYQLEPAEKSRGEAEVKAMAAAAAFYDKTLGKFPFDHYECFDATGYYGIESYSHTLLAKGITLRFISHEMGHTYFGAIGPCAYTRDSWNESLTQYIDSIVYQNNNDRTLELGLRTAALKVPLTKMPIAHEYDSATYYRGAYVMRMLEDEIGRENVLQGLRDLLKDRVGKDTAWPDLRLYFEKASGKKLDWFWQQWISNADFPTLKVQQFDSVQIERRWRTRVTVVQSGTPDPFQLRFMVRVRRGPSTSDQVVTMKAPGGVFAVESDFQPTSAEVVAFPYTIARI
jgi:hypothetical protein